jgi:hypothetical protein
LALIFVPKVLIHEGISTALQRTAGHAASSGSTPSGRL